MISNKFVIKDIIILILISILFIHGVNTNNIYITIGCITFLLAMNVVFSLRNIKERIVFFIFQITFFTFLVGRLILDNFFQDSVLFTYGFNFSDDIINHVIISIFISLIFLRLGYVITAANNKINKIAPLNYESVYIRSVRKSSKILMYLALIPQLLILFEKAILVQNLGYEAYYTDYESNLPFIVLKLGMLYEAMTFLFLATMPSKKECKLPLIIFFIVGCLSLSYGQRNGFLLKTIFIFIYLIVRDQINSGGLIWFKRKYILPIIIIIPFLITFLLAFGSYREGEKFNSDTLVNNVALFFFSQGSTANLIGYAKEDEGILPENKFYSLGPLISFFKENAIAKVFIEVPKYQASRMEQALDGHQFSLAISYLHFNYKGAFLLGSGLGSCYIAELWADFGYTGIAFGSFLYGLLMAMFLKFCKRSIWLATFSFSGALAIIYAPRAEFSDFLQIFLSWVNLIAFFLIHLLAKKWALRQGRTFWLERFKQQSKVP
jgi:oligosaccharide repeat unit polymerase